MYRDSTRTPHAKARTIEIRAARRQKASTRTISTPTRDTLNMARTRSL